jgi:geranylgeranyl pyrophosphate synthase
MSLMFMNKIKPYLLGIKSSPLLKLYLENYSFILKASQKYLPSKAQGFLKSEFLNNAVDLSAISSLINKPSKLYIDRPGKLLRPLITCMILKSAGKNCRKFESVIGAIELMEASTVSFDDLIDFSDIRRGNQSTHKKYGEETAYLAYHAAYNWAWKAFLDLDIPAARKNYLLNLLGREIFAYGYGQCQELYWSKNKIIPSKENYLSQTFDRVRFLSFNGPFRIGAVLSECPIKTLAYLEKAGSYLGMAYHLRGDYLNLFACSNEFGKPLADDIPSARMTLLSIGAIERTKGEKRKFLLSALGNKNISKSKLKKAISIIEESGAIDYNNVKIDEFAEKSLAFIKLARMPRKWENLFADLISYMAYDRLK